MMKFFINILIISQVFFYSSVFSQTSKVTISETDSGFELLKDNKPYYIKGAGAKNNFKKVGLKIFLVEKSDSDLSIKPKA